MIRYPISTDELRTRIIEISPNWFDRAADALANLPDAPKSADFKSLWGDIKQVYIDLQHSKCAFCEKPLENRIEQDVEHFRPKSEVTHWTVPQDLLDAGVVVRQPADGKAESGYRYLAYHPFNYAASCKNCNSVFKGNFFPIGRPRKTRARRPPSITVEQPFLIYPIGDLDENPEELIGFVGLSPMAVPASGIGRLRALVTIAIFKLGDPIERKMFLLERAGAIERLYFGLEEISANANADAVARAQAAVARSLRSSAPFANCLRCFRRLYDRSREEARRMYDDIANFLNSFSPA